MSIRRLPAASVTTTAMRARVLLPACDALLAAAAMRRGSRMTIRARAPAAIDVRAGDEVYVLAL